MKLADVEIDDLVQALRQKRSAWIKVATDEGRRHTEAERMTICVLAAFGNAKRVNKRIRRRVSA